MRKPHLSRMSFIPAALLALFALSRCSGSGESEHVPSEYELQAEADAKQDRQVVVFDGMEINELACDTTVRKMPDGSWVTITTVRLTIHGRAATDCSSMA